MCNDTPPPKNPSVGTVTAGAWKGLLLLREARAAAQTAGRDLWEFAVEVRELRAVGLSHTDLRRLLAAGLTEHRAERTQVAGARRCFRALASLAIPESACFVLTAAGAALADSCQAGPGVLQPHRVMPASPPHWDELRRRLCWQGLLVKEFRQPAGNQELILAALQEEAWPARVYDPLPRRHGQDPKMRLRAAVKALNHHQLHRLIHFRCDGRGEGVGWGDAWEA
jgi:hypothetical protein